MIWKEADGWPIETWQVGSSLINWSFLEGSLLGFFYNVTQVLSTLNLKAIFPLIIQKSRETLCLTLSPSFFWSLWMVGSRSSVLCCGVGYGVQDGVAWRTV